MYHINLNDKGVLVWDPDLRKAVQLYFSKQGITCQEDEKTESCKHVMFALSKPDIQEVIRKRKKEDWELPDV